MGDAESDEHLRLFKCLVDTGADVLRNTVERKMLINSSFEHYLCQNKHKFYHQFEKRRYKPCCSGNPHNCVVNGKMDKHIFFKMFNKKAELDTQDCLDRFEVNADISVDKLDLSDLNFFLWNSATLSPQEEQSLKAIMTTRSAICHSSSSRIYSLNELENFWRSLRNDVLLFAEPYRYKKSVEREIIALRNYNLSKTESTKILDEMNVELTKILHEIKLETQTKNNSLENMVKEENVGLKNCIRLENDSTKTHMNDKMQELIENFEKGSRTMNRCKKRIKAKVQREGMKTRLQSKRNRNILNTKLTDSERTICQKVKSTKIRMNKMLKLTQEEMDQNSKRFKSIQTQQRENNKKHQLTTIECKDEIKAKVKREGRKTRLHNEDQTNSFHQNLTETEMKIDKRVAQSQTQLSTKMEEEAHETRRQIKTGFKILLGVLGKQNITLGINQEQIEQLIESSDAQDIYITSKLDQHCLTADKEKNVIENLQSEIQIPTDNDINPDISDKQAFQVIVKKVNSIILKMKATPGIFKSVETLKSALLTLVKNVQIAGKIDVGIEDTVTVDLSFDSPLTKDQIAVVKCLFSKEWNDDNSDKQLSKEHSSSGVAKIESYSDHETSSHQDLFSTTHPYDCKNCFEKDEIIILLDRRLCQIRRHLVQIKENQLSEKTLLKGDLVKLITLATDTICADESTSIAEKETKSNIYSLRSDKMALDSDVHHNRTTTLRKDIGEGSLKLYQPNEKSDVSSRLLEIKREYARHFYTKTAEQKGLAVIFHGDGTRFSHRKGPDILHLQEFFEEIGFVVEHIKESTIRHLSKYMTDGKFYCVFMLFIDFEDYEEEEHIILYILSQRTIGKPVVVMTDSIFNFPHLREINDDIDILIVMPNSQMFRGRGLYPYPGVKNCFDDFMKVTRSNRCADIIDILTRINSLYDYPVITFQSSLRKKLSFL